MKCNQAKSSSHPALSQIKLLACSRQELTDACIVPPLGWLMLILGGQRLIRVALALYEPHWGRLYGISELQTLHPLVAR